MKEAMRGFPAFFNLDARLSSILPTNLLSHSAWLGSDRIGCDCDHCSLPTFLAVPTAAECRTSQVVRQSTLQRSFTLSANKIRSIRRDSTGHLQRLLEPYSTIVVRCAVTTLPSDSNTHAQNNESVRSSGHDARVYMCYGNVHDRKGRVRVIVLALCRHLISPPSSWPQPRQIRLELTVQTTSDHYLQCRATAFYSSTWHGDLAFQHECGTFM